MSPQEKALQLKETFNNSKEYMLACVDEILNNFGNLTDGKPHYCDYAAVKYYREVRKEIENL